MLLFLDWVAPCPRDSTKFYCKLCDVSNKAHVTTLQRHRNGKTHIENAQKSAAAAGKTVPINALFKSLPNDALKREQAVKVKAYS